MPYAIRIHRGRKDTVYAWSPSALETILLCPRKWHFEKSRKVISVALAVGSFIHRKIEQLRLNPKFKSAQSWANHCRAVWYHFHANRDKLPNTINGQTIEWKTREDPHLAAGKIVSMTKRHFDRLMSEEPPVIFDCMTKTGKRYRTVEYPFRFVIDDGIKKRALSGIIDEVRPGMVIRDYKSGYRSYVVRKIQYVFQPTYYNFGYCTLCHLDPSFRERVGVLDNLAASWGGNPHIISEDVVFHFFTLQNTRRIKEIRDGREVEVEIVEEPVVPITKNDFNFFELCQVIDYAEYLRLLMLEHKSYPAWRGIHCEYCLSKAQCEKMTSNLPITPIQLYFFSPRQEVKLLTQTTKQLVFDFFKE